MEGSLYDYILLSVNTPAYFMSLSRGYIHLVSQAAKLKAVFETSRGAIITCSQYTPVFDRQRTQMMPQARRTPPSLSQAGART